MPVGKGWDRKLRERRIFTAHQAGFTDEEIANTMRLNPKTVRRILDRAGVDVEEVVAKRKEGTQEMPKKKKPVPRRDFEELWEQSTRNLEMLCGREFRQQLDNGEVERIAAERGVPYQDAFAQLQDEAYRPLTEAMQSRQEARQRAAARTLEVDEEALDRRARSYAERHGTSYSVALDSVIGTTPGARRAVELEEAPLRVDDAEEAISLEAEARARREGCTFEAALDAVLAERS